MKLKYKFSMIEVGDEINAVPVGAGAKAFHGILNLNETGKTIMTLLEQDREPDAVVAHFIASYPDMDPAEIREDVMDFIQQLLAHGLLI